MIGAVLKHFNFGYSIALVGHQLYFVLPNPGGNVKAFLAYEFSADCNKFTDDCTKLALGFTELVVDCTKLAPGCTILAPGCTKLAPGCTKLAPGCTKFAPGCTKLAPGCIKLAPDRTSLLVAPLSWVFGYGQWDEVSIVGVDVTGVRRLESGQLDKKPVGVDKTGVWVLVELD